MYGSVETEITTAFKWIRKMSILIFFHPPNSMIRAPRKRTTVNLFLYYTHLPSYLISFREQKNLKLAVLRIG